jgi:hypothetical protein
MRQTLITGIGRGYVSATMGLKIVLPRDAARFI